MKANSTQACGLGLRSFSQHSAAFLSISPSLNNSFSLCAPLPTANNQQVLSSKPFLRFSVLTGVKLVLPHFGSPLLSLVPSLVNVVSAACERADNKAPQNGNARSLRRRRLPPSPRSLQWRVS